MGNPRLSTSSWTRRKMKGIRVCPHKASLVRPVFSFVVFLEALINWTASRLGSVVLDHMAHVTKECWEGTPCHSACCRWWSGCSAVQFWWWTYKLQIPWTLQSFLDYSHNELQTLPSLPSDLVNVFARGLCALNLASKLQLIVSAAKYQVFVNSLKRDKEIYPDFSSWAVDCSSILPCLVY